MKKESSPALGCSRGLDDRTAKAWDALFKALRLSQRRFLALENVPGLVKHKDFPEIAAAFRSCGYVLISQRLVEATGIGCTARLRAILLLWNDADWDANRPPHSRANPVRSHPEGSHALCRGRFCAHAPAAPPHPTRGPGPF